MIASAELLVLPEAVRRGAAGLHVLAYGAEQGHLAIDGRVSEELQDPRLPLVEGAGQAVMESRPLSVQRCECLDEVPN